MINVRTFQCNMLQENCYVVSDETREAVIIDCGAFYKEENAAISQYIEQQQLNPVHLLCTHGHFDHNFGVQYLNTAYGLQPELHADDEFLYNASWEQAGEMLGVAFNNDSMPPVGHYLTDGERITFGTHQLQALHTPGHSPGGMIFYCAEEKVVFTGDTLFRMSVGRTDLHRGSWGDLINSLQTIVAQLPADTKVYCGHGPHTTIGDELRMNPFLKK